jgi:hypothetical protein
MVSSTIEKVKRECGGCTICCDGWATGEAHGHKFYPGRKCFFVGEKGCTIYKDRPQEPCINFNCKWLTDDRIPEWMKPNLVNVLIAEENKMGIKFLTVKEAGKKLDSEVLSWIVLAHLTGIYPNIRYELNGGWNFMGTPEFMQLMTGIPQPEQNKVRKQL